MTVTGRHPSRLYPVLLGAMVLAALLLRYRGVDWPDLHPDEPTIARWSVWTQEHAFIDEQFYAGGFFQLSKPVIRMGDGLRAATQRWRDFTGTAGTGAAPAMRRILVLRIFNVWLGTLTVWLFYWLAREVTGQRTAALAAALFLALANVHIEHAHYAETDIAMLFSLTLALGCWARRANRAAGVWGYLLASFLTGWAVGTKFTLGPLLFNIPVGAWAVARAGRRPAVRVAGVALAGLLAAATGVVCTNPGMLHVRWFWPQMTTSLALLYDEHRRGLSHPATGGPWVMLWSNWNTWREGLAGMGIGWAILAFAGFPIAFSRPYRRFWPVTILFPLLYLVYFLFMAPWTRGQEFMSLYPAFAVWCALSVAGLAALLKRWNRPALSGLALLAIVGAAGAESGLRALRISSLFRLPDPRVQAAEWLLMHAPLDAVVGIEAYTHPIVCVFPQNQDIGQVERMPWRKQEDRHLAYVARNPLSQGRGAVDPRTRRLYPEYERNLRESTRLACRLCTWGPVTAERYTFAGHPIEWWSRRRAQAPDSAVRLPVVRPVRLQSNRLISVPGTDSGLGSVAGMWVDRTPRRFVVNGPAGTARPLFVILQTAERSAVVRVAGLGCSRRVSLAPYDAAAVALQRPWWKPRFSAYDVIRVGAVPEPHIVRIPCQAQVAATAAEAAGALFQKGYPDQALALLEAEQAVDGATAWLAYCSAVAAENWPAADRWQTAALHMLERLDAVNALPPAAVRVNGVAGTDLLAHRRIRLNLQQEIFLAKDNEDRDDRQIEPYIARWPLPVRLAKGRYRIRFAIEKAGSSAPPDAFWPIGVRDSLGGRKQNWALNADGRPSFEHALCVEAESDVEMAFSSAQEGSFLISRIEILWDSEDLLGAERRELYRARAAHLLHEAADLNPAREWIDKALAAFPDDAVLQRLKEDAGRKPAAEGRGAAPSHVFYPWLRLAAAEEQKEGARTLCFDVLRDNPPPLKLKAFASERRQARPYFESPLTGRPLARGDRVRVTVPAPPGGSLRDIALRVESAPRWLPRPLRIVGRAGPTLKLAEVAGAPP